MPDTDKSPPDKPPREGRPLPSGLLAFLFTDIEGSTQRWEKWPDAMQSALAQHDRIIRAAAANGGAHVFRAEGDAFCLAFRSSTRALAAAITIQQAFARPGAFDDIGGLKVRIALHVGEAEARNGNYFGMPLNRVARLLSVTYGGQILLSSAAAELVRHNLPAHTRLLDLGLHRLRDLAGPERIYQVEAPDLILGFPPLRTLSGKFHNLPQQVASFVGRDAAVSEIRTSLAQHRLVSLVGAGGLGKTRTALQVGRSLVDDYHDGVWLIELASIEGSDRVAELLCQVLGVPVHGSRTALESVLIYLRDRKALLIVDNCEHVLSGAATVISAIMRSCPSIAILASSREALGIEGEWTIQVANLDYPSSSTGITAEMAQTFSAVQLFVERATAVTGDFRLIDQNAQDVCNICRQLEGIPLAIELAVPVLRMMRPDQLSRKLDDRFRVLIGSPRTATARQQTLRALFDWSYNLLNRQEQALLRRLAVLPGGWTLDSAAHIASGDPIAPEAMFELTSALVQKSFAFADRSSEEPRFRMLETTRQYGFAKLKESGESGYRRRSAAYLLGFFQQAEEVWPVTSTQVWLATYAPEVENLRASLEWAFGPEGDPNLGLELASHTLRIWDELAMLPERRRWFATAVDRIEPATSPSTEARLWLGRTSVSAHGDRSGLGPAERAAALFQSIDDHLGWGEALTKAGAALLTPTTVEEAEPFLRDALNLLRPLGPTKQLASCLKSLALSQTFQKAFEVARPLLHESMAIAHAIGDTRGLLSTEINLAELEFACSELDPAISRVRRMIEGGLHNRRQLALGLSNLTAYLIAAGRINEARQSAEACLQESRVLGDPAAAARIAEHVAVIALHKGNSDLAARLLGFGSNFYARGTASREHTEQTSYQAALSSLEQSCSPAALARLLAEGATWTDEHAVAEGLAFCRA